MADHETNAYHDGNKWVVFCAKCGKEDDELKGSECSEKYVDKSVDKGSEHK